MISSSVLPNVLVGVALTDGEHGSVVTVLDEVAAEVLVHAFHGLSSDVFLQTADAVWRKIADHSAVAIELLDTIVQEPLADQRRYAALLLAEHGVLGMYCVHV